MDTQGTAEIEDKANPSLEALKIVEAIPVGFEGTVVWMTRPPNAGEEDYDFQPREAVWVSECPSTDKFIYKLMSL